MIQRSTLWIRLAPLLLAAIACSAGGETKGETGAATKLFAGGAAAYVVEVQGKTLWSHRSDQELPPASLTKVMTALLFLESGKPLDGVVTVSAEAQRATGARLRLRAGDRIRARDLLAASLLASANDACLALAEHVAGDKARFVALMNRRARELGLTRTHFSNPCGHDEPKHLSTARDLAGLAEAAMRQPVFAELVRSVESRVSTLDGRSFKVENRNELVGRYPGSVGVKSGFTARAGKCLIVMARKGGITVLLVVLNAPNRWWDAEAALDLAFAAAKPLPRSKN